MIARYFILFIYLMIGDSWASQKDPDFDQSSPYRVLFLCTGNSCRSQMAEGWARYLGGTTLEANSAGIEAHGLNPKAVRVMAEVGVNITSQTSKILTPHMLEDVSLVVTVCGHADESCPRLKPGVKKIYWPLSDPAKASGTEEEILSKFREIRDDIKVRTLNLIDFIQS